MGEGGEQPASVLKVVAKESVAQDVLSLTLAHPDGLRLPDWAPGAHIDVVLPDGQARQYSLCGDRWDAFTYRIGVLRDGAGRGGSIFIHDDLVVGDVIGYGGPRNNFRLAPARRYLFIAGGIGITPLLPMIRQAEIGGVEWQLVYGGRTRGSMAFLDELSDYGDRVEVMPQDEVGFPDLVGILGADDPVPDGDPAAFKVYVCGPAGLLDAVDALCTHWPAGRVRMERFVPRDTGNPVRDTPFEVELARSGTVVTVSPEASILDTLRRRGIGVLSSCRVGTCGTCETDVLAGIPDHRDSVLADHERSAAASMLICVSRSCSDRIVLDL